MSKFDVKIGDSHKQDQRDFDGKNGRWPGMCDKNRVRERRS